MQWWAKWRLSTFNLYPWGEGHGVQGLICDILRPQQAMNRFLPLWPHRFLHFGYINLGGGGVGGLLDRCRAFDLFASVDAHLCMSGINRGGIFLYWSAECLHFLLDSGPSRSKKAVVGGWKGLCNQLAIFFKSYTIESVISVYAHMVF